MTVRGNVDLGHVGQESWVCVQVSGADRQGPGEVPTTEPCDFSAALRGKAPAEGQTHSHKQENAKGQVQTMEKAPQEEGDNFLSAPLETDADRRVLRM